MDHGTKQIAKERIRILFEQAEMAREASPTLSKRYVETARKIAMAARIRLPPRYKSQICKKCNSLLVIGGNCSVRIQQKREPHLVVTCLDCGSQKRILLRKKKERNKIEQNNNPNEIAR